VAPVHHMFVNPSVAIPRVGCSRIVLYLPNCTSGSLALPT